MTPHFYLQWNKITLASLAMVAFILLLLSYNIIAWIQDLRLINEPLPPAIVINTLNKVGAIPEAHLFGKALGPGDVPISDLELTVTGIVKTENQHDDSITSKAYLSLSGQPSKIYRVGDELPYGVKIVEITHDAVILDNGGRIEKLPLPRKKLIFKERNEARYE